MNSLVDRYALDAAKLLQYLYKSPVFENSKRGILQRGLQSYFAGDVLCALHLLIPQIEDAVRNLVELVGGTVLKRGRGGGLHLKTLDELLRDEQVKRVLGEDVSLYLRVLLTDQRGINLRNNVCHGISPEKSFNIALADRVIHAILILAQVRKKVEN